MAISFCTATSSNGSTASLTFSHSVVGNNRLLVVGVAVNIDFAGSAGVLGITFDGAALSPARGDWNDNNISSSLWYLVNPGATTANVVVNLTASLAVAAGAVSFEGVDQSNPIGQVGSNQGAAQTMQAICTVTASDNWLVDCEAAQFRDAAGTITSDIAQTRRIQDEYDGGNNAKSAYLCMSTESPGIIHTETSIYSGPYAVEYALSVIEIKAAITSQRTNGRQAGFNLTWLY